MGGGGGGGGGLGLGGTCDEKWAGVRGQKSQLGGTRKKIEEKNGTRASRKKMGKEEKQTPPRPPPQLHYT